MKLSEEALKKEMEKNEQLENQLRILKTENERLKLNEQLAVRNSKVLLKQLTKAEKILRELIEDAKKFDYIQQISFDLISRAFNLTLNVEKFLKESENG